MHFMSITFDNTTHNVVHLMWAIDYCGPDSLVKDKVFVEFMGHSLEGLVHSAA